MPASAMCAGVGKSGSPAANGATRTPWAFSAFALAAMASVSDSTRLPAWRAKVGMGREPTRSRSRIVRRAREASGEGERVRSPNATGRSSAGLARVPRIVLARTPRDLMPPAAPGDLLWYPFGIGTRTRWAFACA